VIFGVHVVSASFFSLTQRKLLHKLQLYFYGVELLFFLLEEESTIPLYMCKRLKRDSEYNTGLCCALYLMLQLKKQKERKRGKHFTTRIRQIAACCYNVKIAIQ